jgi:hypothetical protein
MMIMTTTTSKIGKCICKLPICAALSVKTATSNNLQDAYRHIGTYTLGIHPGFYSNCRPSFCHLLCRVVSSLLAYRCVMEFRGKTTGRPTISIHSFPDPYVK